MIGFMRFLWQRHRQSHLELLLSNGLRCEEIASIIQLATHLPTSIIYIRVAGPSLSNDPLRHVTSRRTQGAKSCCRHATLPQWNTQFLCSLLTFSVLADRGSTGSSICCGRTACGTQTSCSPWSSSNSTSFLCYVDSGHKYSIGWLRLPWLYHVGYEVLQICRWTDQK